MNSISWLVEDFPQEHPTNFASLKDEIIKQGHIVETITIADHFNKLVNNGQPFKGFGHNDCVLFQGSMFLAEAVRTTKQWVPGVWYSHREYQCDFYYPYFTGHLFNECFALYPRESFKDQIEHVFNIYGRDDSIFIRPTSGNKTFGGQLLKWEDLETDLLYIDSVTEPYNLILVSTPKTILSEHRTIVDGKQIIACSQYKKNDKLVLKEGMPDKAREFVLKVLNNLKFPCPHPLYSLDVAEDADGRFWVLEIGAFSCSGFYACNQSDIVRVASELAYKEWVDYYA